MSVNNSGQSEDEENAILVESLLFQNYGNNYRDFVENSTTNRSERIVRFINQTFGLSNKAKYLRFTTEARAMKIRQLNPTPQSSKSNVYLPRKATSSDEDDVVPKKIPKKSMPSKDVPIAESDEKKEFSLIFYDVENEIEREISFFVEKPEILVKDVLYEMKEELCKKLRPITNDLRMVEILNHRIFNLVDGGENAEVLSNASSARYFRGEEIFRDEIKLKRNEMMVQVSHFDKEIQAAFGFPFLIKIRFGEVWSAVKNRLKIRLGLNEKDWGEMGMRVAHVTNGKDVRYLGEDDDEVTVKARDFKTTSNRFAWRPWIGIEHENPEKRLKQSIIETNQVNSKD